MADNKRKSLKAVVNPMKLSLANRYLYGRKRRKRVGQEEEEEIIKKRKINNNGKTIYKCDGLGDSEVISSRSIFDCGDIMRDILSRLPIKSLMRFKCVSKHWQSSICQDRDLIDLHSTRSTQHCPDLFIVVPRHEKVDSFRSRMRKSVLKDKGRLFRNQPVRIIPQGFGSDLKSKISTTKYGGGREYSYKQSILLAKLFQTSNTNIRRLEHKRPFYYTQILKPVNGLICFVNRCKAAVRIMNPSTRELTPWISSSLRRDERLDFDAKNERGRCSPAYFFGFDPATKRHKVICTWRIDSRRVRHDPEIMGGTSEDICEVLTVGENTWRRIQDKVPFFYPLAVIPCVYANGFIYWGNKPYGIPDFLIAFDVGREEFRVTRVPVEIRMNPPKRCRCNSSDTLIEVNGHIALLRRWTSKVVKIWICNDHASIDSYDKWTEVNMELPFRWGNDTGAFFHSVAGADRIVIQSNSTNFRSHIKEAALYSYDLEKKALTGKVKSGVVSDLVSVSLSSKLESVTLFRTFQESLWPVRNQVDVLKTAINNLKFKISNLEVRAKLWQAIEAIAKAESKKIEAFNKVSAIEKTLATKKILLQAKEAELATAAGDNNIAC